MFFYDFLRPVFMRMDAEKAHNLTISLLKRGFGPMQSFADPVLAVNVWGRDFGNPLGIAAGFDKDAEALPALFGMGFGFVEAGTVTPRPQDGNPKPRVFRDIKNRSVVNRMGFPGKGLDAFAENVARYRLHYRTSQGILGINIGINKDALSPVDDYRKGIAALGRFADYITVNISSPNTEGLRALQEKDELNRLLDGLLEERGALKRFVPLLVKVAPDLDAAQREAMAGVFLAHGIDGLVVSNTTVSRPEALAKDLREEKGGLSGALLRDLAAERLADFYALTGGKLPIIGAGGISSAQDAYARIRAGATLLQIYTALVYGGPDLVISILKGLAALLKRDGYAHLSQAVGADVPSVTPHLKKAAG